ncbi:MAG TPA: GAF domain-containing sensor histidine kinase [Nitrospira sp.]|nr:GAF domain-containing sensor histidine kinase [Nitrospira sp.]
MTALLSKDHSILEKGQMEFRPYGVNADGRKIRDASGITVRANVEYLEEVVARSKGKSAGTGAVEELARLLNERIPDRAYHVTPVSLRDIWNSYSYEFVMFLAEFCVLLSGDPDFQYHMGEQKLISPIIQTLGRPFGVSQIYRMFPHFGQKYAKGSIHFESEDITDHSAVLRMTFKEHIYRQFGPYRKACAYQICQSSKAALAAFPYLIYGLQPATITDRRCVAEGDDSCEWKFVWVPREPRPVWGAMVGTATGASAFALISSVYPELGWQGTGAVSVLAALAAGLAYTTHILQRKMAMRDRIIKEQVQFVDNRHEELREAYLDQQQAAVDLKRKIGQLTLLYQTGMIVSSTLDRDVLIDTALLAIKHNLNFDRVMISFYDSERKVSRDARLVGVSETVAAFARSIDTPITDPESIEGQLFLKGTPSLITDIRSVWDRLHPLSQKLASMTQAQSIITVPLKVEQRVIGALTVDRLQEHALNEEDLDVMVTVANQLAIALEHASAYREIEELNVGLEEKVRERTAQLEAANEQLKELNQLKSTFVSVVSHELRTPMTSIRVYVENMLDGLTGTLTEKQKQYLGRIQFNIDRLTRMIIDLLDLSRMEAGWVELRQESVAIHELMHEVVDNMRSIAGGKSVTLEARSVSSVDAIQADRDKVTQILTNLIGNAIKFTPSGGRVRVTAEFLEDDGMLRFCVSDNGCGIPPDEVPRVFEKFFRGLTTTSETRGAGLGLAIVKSLVELHGGQIWVDSILGSGSSFFFTLPLTRERESSSTNG